MLKATVKKVPTSKFAIIAEFSAIASVISVVVYQFYCIYIINLIKQYKWKIPFGVEQIRVFLGFAVVVVLILSALLSVGFGIAAIIEIKKSKGALKGVPPAIVSICICLLPILAYLTGIFDRDKRFVLDIAFSNIGGMQETFHRENGEYAKTFDELFSHDPAVFMAQSSYAFFMSPTESLQPNMGGPYSLPPEIRPFVEENRFQIIAVSNLDYDEVLDVWMINEFDPKQKVLIVDDLKYKKWSEVDLKSIKSLRQPMVRPN